MSSLSEFFWARVNRLGPVIRTDLGPCWLWTGGNNGVRGYGVINKCGQRIYAHRFSYALAFGPVPPGMECCHRCDVPACVNPDHLFAASHAENGADMSSKGRSAVQQHPSIILGERNGSSRLTADLVIQMRGRHGAGMTIGAIARLHGLNKYIVRDAVRGRTWAHIPGATPCRP